MIKRKSLFLSTVFATGFLMAAFVTTALAAQITEENAKSIALENAGIKAEDVTFIHSEQEHDDGKTVFDVGFITNTNEEYDYEILAETGEILGIDYKKKSLPASKGSSAKNTPLTQAEEIVLKHVGKPSDQVTFIKKDTDLDDGRIIYEIEFYTDNYQKYEYKVDVESAEIIAWDFDSNSAYARQYDALPDKHNSQSAANKQSKSARQSTADNASAISLDDAKAIALKKAGLKENQVTWGRVYKEQDDGRLIFNGEFFYDTMEYEFEIDAATGTILDWDIESIFD